MNIETPGSSEIRDLIERLVRDADPAIRIESARRLGLLHAEPAIRPLISALGDRDAGVRAHAAGALGRIGSSDAVRSLLTALQDRDWRVRNEAVWALGRIGKSETIPAIAHMLRDRAWHVRWRAAEAIIGFGESASDVLLPFLQDPDRRVRHAAVWALGKIGGIRATAALSGMIMDADFHVQTEAARALNRLQEEETIVSEGEINN